MRVIRGQDFDHLELEVSALTIGNFDGVHCGHRQIIAQAGLFAANLNAPVAVLTFEPHPLSVVDPRRSPPRLTLPDEKIAQLNCAGADVVVMAESRPALLNLTPEEFIERIVVPRFHPTHIVEGASFGFGRGRQGTTDLLRQLGRKHDFEVFVVEPVRLQVEKNHTVLVSSSLIRKLLLEGRVHRAELCLGRPYTLVGTVCHGAGRGMELGFPTANLRCTGQLVPGVGVYVGEAHMEGQTHLAAISIGATPTFGGGSVHVEAHLVDFSGDLYGRAIRLDFHRPLRSQTEFASKDELIQQITADVAQARRFHAERRGVVRQSESFA
ncbi:MAG: bifunctional riboflavin kinase/FAD synthetase [Phycisphaerae bacterium]|nr:bifunctional riboflavin kinase/FAD synthetase [Phycisphaerae bacterium]